MKYLLDNALASTTISVYRRAWALFNYCAYHVLNIKTDISLPLNNKQILMFISFLNMYGFASASITTYITAISYVHKFGNFLDLTIHFSVQKTLAAVNRLTGKLDSRLPITIFILARLVNSLGTTVTNKYHQVLLKAMFTTAFFGLFRIGEITSDSMHMVCLEVAQCKLVNGELNIIIKHFKHNVSQHPIIITLKKQSDEDICPVKAMNDYLAIRGSLPGPLFCYLNGKPVNRNFFSQKLKYSLNFCGYDTKRYKCHSFRIGGASYFSSLGYSDSQLKTMGRWNSNAFLAYIRNQRFILPFS